MNRTRRTDNLVTNRDTSHDLSDSFVTRYDHLFPEVDEPSAKFYLDLMRIYLGLCEGSISFEQATLAVEHLKSNPEFTKYPSNPTLIPIKEEYERRIVDNLQTLKKFNLVTTDSIRSAFSFAFLTSASPLNETDYILLSHLIEDPNSSLVEMARQLGLASRTVSRSLRRLQDRNSLRFICHVDTTAFGINWILVFFTLKEGADWVKLERGLSTFPFTKFILKTATTDFGYATFLIPGGAANLLAFEASIEQLAPSFFSYYSLHLQQTVSSSSNLALLDEKEWSFPEALTGLTKSMPYKPKATPRTLHFKGPLRGLTSLDFIVASKLRLNFRASSSKISQVLQMSGWDVDSGQVLRSTRKLLNRDCILPYVVFGGLELSAKFTFEIICNHDWRERIAAYMQVLPVSNYIISDRGILVWIQVPGEQQVEYYKVFRSLEQEGLVESVKPIMTISHMGSRSMLDLVKNWDYGTQGWTVASELLDLAEHVKRIKDSRYSVTD